MRQLLAFGLLVFLFACSQQASVSMDQVEAYEERLSMAYKNMDSTSLKELLDPNYAMRTPANTVITKRRQMRAMGFEIVDFSKLITEVDSFKERDSIIDVYGRVKMHADIVDTTITGEFKFIRTWVQRGDRLVALSTKMSY